jgi:hypothetical protein
LRVERRGERCCSSEPAEEEESEERVDSLGTAWGRGEPREEGKEEVREWVEILIDVRWV